MGNIALPVNLNWMFLVCVRTPEYPERTHTCKLIKSNVMTRHGLLPSSDEVNKREFWLCFERQQSHLEDRESMKGELVKERKTGESEEERTRWKRRFMADNIYLLLLWVMPLKYVTDADETHSNRSYRPWIDIFLLLAFLFWIQNLEHMTGNKEWVFQQSRTRSIWGNAGLSYTEFIHIGT